MFYKLNSCQSKTNVKKKINKARKKIKQMTDLVNLYLDNLNVLIPKEIKIITGTDNNVITLTKARVLTYQNCSNKIQKKDIRIRTGIRIFSKQQKKKISFAFAALSDKKNRYRRKIIQHRVNLNLYYRMSFASFIRSKYKV